MAPPLPTCGIGEPVAEVVPRLAEVDALLVLADGAPAGVITRQDALAHLSEATDG
jgi:cystathionine beta-synthase